MRPPVLAAARRANTEQETPLNETDAPTQAPAPRERTEEQIQADFLARSASTIAAKLRRMADEVDRHGQHFGKVGQQGHRSSYASVAAEIQHDLLWGFVNLNMDRLVQEGADADIARKAGK